MPTTTPRRTGTLLILICAIAGGVVSVNAVTKAEDFIIPTRAAFLKSLKLDKRELAAVKAALDKGDIAGAGAAYIAYFRKKEIPISLHADMQGERDPKFDTSRVDGYLAGHLEDTYNKYEVPQTGLDWKNNPLTCLTRFPTLFYTSKAIHHTRDAKYVTFTRDHILDYMKAYPIATFAGMQQVEGIFATLANELPPEKAYNELLSIVQDDDFVHKV